MGHTYIAWGGVTSDLTSPLAGVAVTTTPKTLLQILPDPNYPASIIEWGYVYLGASLPTAPVQMELVTTETVFATVTAGSVSNWGDPTGPASQATIGTTATGFNASAEGTIAATRLLDQRAYPSDWAKQFPLGREPKIAAGHCARIRGTGTATVAPYIIWEIG